MGMDFSVYVGPFLVCKRKPGPRPADCELVGEQLSELRGELYVEDGDYRYLGPNVEMPKITRQLCFEPQGETPVLFGIKPMSEMSAFVEQFEKDIAALRTKYETVSVEWGVVPGFA